MKKISMLFVALTTALCTCVQAQSSENHTDAKIDAVTAARAFALKPPAYFELRLSGEALVSNEWSKVNMQFVVRKSDFGITSLTINGTQIPISQALYGLPIGDGGFIRSVRVSANAWTSDRVFAGQGVVYREFVSKGDNVKILLLPDDIRQEIPVPADISDSCRRDLDLDIDGVSSYGYGVDYRDGKFYAYLPPVATPLHYVLRCGNTGQVIGEGWTQPYQKTVTPDSAFVGIQYAGNVIGIDFEGDGEDWTSVPIQFDSSIQTDMGVFMGKVAFMDAGYGGLEVVVGADVHVYVQHASSANEDMPYAQLVDMSVFSENGEVETRVLTAYQRIGKVVVTIIPKAGVPYSNRLWVNFHRYYGPPSGSVTPCPPGYVCTPPVDDGNGSTGGGSGGIPGIPSTGSQPVQ